MKLLLLIPALFAITVFTTSCSSKPKKVDIPVTANPADEIRSFENDLHQAEAEQVSVLSPANYDKAKDYLNDAKDLREKGKSTQDVLDKLGYARAYLNLANENVKKAQKQLPEVLHSRQDAMTSGGQTILASEFKAADNDLKADMGQFEKDPARLSSTEKDKLNKKYLDIELKSIKASYLGQAQSNLELAEKNNAKKLSPKTYASAKDKIMAANRAIETDRHDLDTIGKASADALAETQKLLAINNIVKDSKKMTPEDAALEMNANQKALDKVASQVQSKEEELRNQNQKIRAQNASINAVVGANQQLAGKIADNEKTNESYEAASKKFSADEAEVYRQGPNLLIRLKALDFKSGHADLPKQSFELLNKVKEVIKDMDAQKVVVEGHTDSIGTKGINEKISKERADTVAKYFVSQGAVDQQAVETEGYGFEKPIATNKTKEGRAQNRRVDVIITPSSAE